MSNDSKRKAITKTISWRIIGSLFTVISSSIIFSIIDSISTAALVMGMVEFVSKIILYYIHERIWSKITI
jgi:uncharacterized membrane protein